MSKFSTLLPKEIAAFKSTRADEVYDRGTLYQYMDGGAEVYLAFDFREVFSRLYQSPAGISLNLDIYDMGSGAEAFGVFSCDRADPPAGIGQESTYGVGLLRFRQNRYFVTVTASSDDAETEKAVLALGRSALACLGPDEPRPDMIRLLPTRGLLTERASFFHSEVNLNNRFFIASENILHLGGDTDCLIAEYDAGAAKSATLLLVRYPGSGKARAAYNSFVSAYGPAAGKTGRGKTANGRWFSARHLGRHVAIWFDLPSPQWADAFEVQLSSLVK